MQSITIQGYKSGLKKDKKPFLFPEDAFQVLENAYVYREEVRKRDSSRVVGRLRRVLQNQTTDQSGGAMTYTVPGTGSQTIDLFSLYSPTGTEETSPQIEPAFTGSTNIITIDPGGANETIFTDSAGTGLLTITGASPFADSAWINYLTGIITMNVTTAPGGPLNVTFTNVKYYPFLPCMGITEREIISINQEQTVFYDQKYAYIFDGSNFNEFISGATWNGADDDFFWSTNYRGSDASDRIYFTTNFVNDANSPMRYTDGTTWTTFQPEINKAGTQYLFSARILVPYYGRLVALNTWEGETNGGAVNIPNRCRASQIGSPVANDAWHSDDFGKGILIDAPVNEEIVSARFFKNTLIVFFEQTTWRLTYVGEYGTPFIWERISSDFGSDSTFSTILFDKGVLSIGDKAIVGASSSDVDRIDLGIPDTVFDIQNTQDGPYRVQSGRNFQKEVVYWCYPSASRNAKYPNKMLLFNYRNNTYADFRINSTALGSFYFSSGITWDRTDIYWKDESVFWDDFLQDDLPVVALGNQHGFIHVLGYPSTASGAQPAVNLNDQESLSVTVVTVTTVVTLTIPNHNLQDNDWIYLTGLKFVVNGSTVGSTTLNDKIYQIQPDSTDPSNKIILYVWDVESQNAESNFEVTNVGTYIGGGMVAFLPNPVIQTKDFSPFKEAGMNFKTSSIDFLLDSTPNLSIGVNLVMNTTDEAKGNLDVGNTNIETTQSMSGVVLGATQANPCVISSKDHGLLDNDMVSFSNVGGMTELNGNIYTVTFVSTDEFSIGVDSTGYGVYTQGGLWTQINEKYFTLTSKYGWHRFFANSYGQYMSVKLSYSNDQMSRIATHQQDFILNAMQISFQKAGRNIFGK